MIVLVMIDSDEVGYIVGYDDDSNVVDYEVGDANLCILLLLCFIDIW